MKLHFGLIYVAAAIALIVLPAAAQDDTASTKALRMVGDAGSPIDWTHFHVVFSSASGDRSQQSILQSEPRYWLQVSRRQGSQEADSSEASDAVRIASARLAWQLQHKSPEGDSAVRSIGDPDEADFGTSRFGWKDRDPERLRRDWTQTFTNGTVYTFNSPTYPAKFSFSGANLSPSCSSDYVVFTLPTGGAAPGNFDIIAYNNLYVTASGGAAFCPGGAPQAIFEYNASTANGVLNGSPALSLDGTLIAFVENATAGNGGAVFHVLKWHSGDTQKVDTLFPQAFNLTTLGSCAANGAAAPCEYNLRYTPLILFGSGTPATLSSPFVDYTNDVAYVTDDAGNVYAIAPVFTATPANPPKVQSGWPINVGASVVLTPPVYDSTSQNVFVADTVGTEFFIKTSGSITGTCASGSPPCLGSNTFAFTGAGTVFESPIVDSSTGKVFLFGTQTGGTSGSYVIQTDTALTSGSVQAAQIGTGTLNEIKSGTPDNNYFTSVTIGKLYACGQNTSGEGLLYAFPFNASGVMSTTPVAGSPFALGQAANSDAFCSAGLTENFNQSSGTDWLFAGVANRCVNTVFGGNGCVISFDVTNNFPSAVASQIAVGGNPQLTGPSGMIVDNATDAASTTITTDIYFIFPGGRSCLDYLGSSHTGTCAGSATQSGLQ